GGAGYVGSHTALALATAGYDVTIFDNLSAGHREVAERLAGAFPDRTIRLVEGDLQDGPGLSRALAASGASAVLHFAARVLVEESTRDPSLYYRANLLGTLNLLDAMKDAHVQRLVFSSTCATFGEPMSPSLDETHPQRPINTYGETKLAVERALPHFERAY